MSLATRWCLCAAILLSLVYFHAPFPNITSYNVLVLMVEKSATNRFDLVHIGPAIDIAQKKCLSEYNVDLNLITGTYSDQCNETAALGNAIDVASETKIVALIGPACSDDVQIVGRLAAYKGIPLLTGLGDVIVDERNAYSTLIRTSYDLRDKAKAILAFMSHHNWFHFGLIFRYQDIYYSTLADELMALLKNKKKYGQFVCTCKESYARDMSKRIITNLDHIMNKMRTCSRIVVIIGGEREVRAMMLIAYSLNMTSGDYAFIYTELIEREAIGNTSWAGGSELPQIKEKLKLAYQSLMIVSLNQPPGVDYKNFSEEVKDLALSKYNFTYNEQVANYFTASFHDSVILLCKCLQESQQENPLFYSEPIEKIRLKILRQMRNVTFLGISGNVTLDAEGDRIADYALLDQTDTEGGLFEVVLRYYGATRKYESISKINWPNARPPNDWPECGFDGTKCKRFTFWEIMISAMTTLLFILIISVIFIFKRIKYNSSLTNMSWKIRWDEIEQVSPDKFIKKDEHKGIDTNSLASFKDTVTTGFHKGNQVVVKKLRTNKLDITKDLLIELKVMRETSHDNLVRFIGICTENCIAIVTEYCAKGSLKELLANSSLNLDWMFRCSIINDIIAGMIYLHNSEHGFHGRLNSNNCLVDSRFCVKISDFGLRKLKHDTGYFYGCNSVNNLTDSMPNLQFKLSRKCQHNCLVEHTDKLLYIAPEFFFACKCKKGHTDNFCVKIDSGTQKGDVYSFGIVLQEIILRREPFYPYTNRMDLIGIVKSCKFEHLRPGVSADSCIPELHSLMVKCWSPNPDDRIDFSLMKYEMKSIMKSLGLNSSLSSNSTLTENLLIRMEQYANDLEMIVKQRTNELAEEKKKTEELLYQILPKPVADQLKKGKMYDPNFFDSVTIYFSDIVGFTHLCSKSTPMQVVDFLNDLYNFFDSIISFDYDVYKVETIGDSYMVVSGLPERNGVEHARQICRMALKILELLPNFKIKHQPEEKLKLRIGINTGPCAAGVVGHKMPRYCLFGDTVNTASRMESHGEPLKIHVSSSTKSVLDLFGTFVLEPRGEISIKGKGKMLTYWLLGEN